MDDNDELMAAIERLRKLENPDKKIFYVYYNPTDGSINHVRNYFENDSSPYIEISEDDIDFSNFNIEDYCVLNDNNQMKLVKIEQSLVLDRLVNIKYFAYEIPKILTHTKYEITDKDIIIEQNSWDKEFKISLSKEWIDMFGDSKNLRNDITLYVTAEQDPNILYKILNCSVETLIDHPVIIEYDEFVDCPCSIYGTKYFEKYIHVHYV